MREIYLLKEFYHLDSGEINYFVESYVSKDEAMKSFRKKIQELIKEEGFKEISSTHCFSRLADKHGNQQELEVELSLLNESNAEENKQTLFLDELNGEKIIATTSQENVHSLKIAIKDFIKNHPQAMASDILDYFGLVEVDYYYLDLI